MKIILEAEEAREIQTIKPPNTSDSAAIFYWNLLDITGMEMYAQILMEVNWRTSLRNLINYGRY